MFGLSKKSLVIAGAVVAAVLVLSAFARSGGAASGEEGSGSGGCAFTVTADVLNVREGPSRQATVVGSLADGKRITALPATKNGYRKLGDGRWVSQRFLDPAPGAC